MGKKIFTSVGIFLCSFVIALVVQTSLCLSFGKLDGLMLLLVMGTTTAVYVVAGILLLILRPWRSAKPFKRTLIVVLSPLVLPFLASAFMIAVTAGSDFLGPMVGWLFAFIVMSATLPLLIILAVTGYLLGEYFKAAGTTSGEGEGSALKRSVVLTVTYGCMVICAFWGIHDLNAESGKSLLVNAVRPIARHMIVGQPATTHEFAKDDRGVMKASDFYDVIPHRGDSYLPPAPMPAPSEAEPAK